MNHRSNKLNNDRSKAYVGNRDNSVDLNEKGRSMKLVSDAMHQHLMKHGFMISVYQSSVQAVRNTKNSRLILRVTSENTMVNFEITREIRAKGDIQAKSKRSTLLPEICVQMIATLFTEATNDSKIEGQSSVSATQA